MVVSHILNARGTLFTREQNCQFVNHGSKPVKSGWSHRRRESSAPNATDNIQNHITSFSLVMARLELIPFFCTRCDLTLVLCHALCDCCIRSLALYG